MEAGTCSNCKGNNWMLYCYYSPYLKKEVKSFICNTCGNQKKGAVAKKDETFDCKGNKVSVKYAPKDGGFSARMLPLYENTKKFC